VSNNPVAHETAGASDGYVTLVVRVWVGTNGNLIRGVIEDVHTGARLPVDLSALTLFLRESLAHASPGQLEELPNNAPGSDAGNRGAEEDA
jgi:hypothetical protein